MAQKFEAQGGVGGEVWDDGVHEGVRKVHVGQGQDGVSFINVVYEKNSLEVEGGEHGKKSLLGFETVCIVFGSILAFPLLNFALSILFAITKTIYQAKPKS